MYIAKYKHVYHSSSEIHVDFQVIEADSLNDARGIIMHWGLSQLTDFKLVSLYPALTKNYRNSKHDLI